MAADTDLFVKNGAELLDRLIKDIIAEQATTYVSSIINSSTVVTDSTTDPISVPQTTAFSLPRFIPLLSERIHVTDPFTRSFLVSWIAMLDTIPDLELVSYLPAFLDGLLQFLSDPNKDIRYATSNILANFLAEIREAAAQVCKAVVRFSEIPMFQCDVLIWAHARSCCRPPDRSPFLLLSEDQH